MAERERFELSERSSRSPAFEAGAFNHSTTSPPLCFRAQALYLFLAREAFRTEELLQLFGCLGLQNARSNLRPMIRAG